MTSIAYDGNTRKPTSVIDVDGVATTYSYSDDLDRLTQIHRAPGGGSSVDSHTNYAYPNPTQVIQYTSQTPTWDIRGDDLYDHLGRLSEHRDYEDTTHYISTTLNYDALSRVATVSNPYRPNDPVNNTSYSYDALNRTTRTQTADGSFATNGYTGNTSTSQDQAGKTRQTVTDSLGRVTQSDRRSGQRTASELHDHLRLRRPR